MRRSALAALTLILLGSCVNEGPPSGPGTLTATLRSPNGAEGGAVLVLVGEGIAEITALGDTEAHARAGAGSATVVLINQTGGTLTFEVEVEDATRPPTAIIEEVAGPDDELRGDLTGYTLELAR